MATTHIDYRKIDYDQLLDKPIIRTDASVDTLTTAGVYDKGDGKRYIVSVNGQNITQVIEEKDGYQTRSSIDGGTTWGAWETVVFSKSGDIDAEDVNYDNTTSGLIATNVQAAIDEIDTSVDDVKGDITDIQTDITNIQGDITNIQGDITDIKNIIEVETMPTPSEDTEGTIIQYKGVTNANFTHGYFYECVSDGQTPATYSWERIDVQPAGAGDEHEFITQTAYNALTPAQKAAKVYMIKEEGVPGSGLIAGAGIDITNNTISADMSTAVYDNTTSGATATNVQDAIDEVFQSVSNGKELIADAITDKGVSTSATDSFQTMATNISNIETLDIAAETTKINAVTGGNAIAIGGLGSTPNKFSVIYSDKRFTVILERGDDSLGFTVVNTAGIGVFGSASGFGNYTTGTEIMNIVSDGTYCYALVKYVRSSGTTYYMVKLSITTGQGTNHFKTNYEPTNLGNNENVAVETFNTETVGCVADQGIVTGLSTFASGIGSNLQFFGMQIDYTKVL